MSRVFNHDTLVIATHNVGKVREIADLLKPYVRVFHAAGELGLPEPDETGVTFSENAKIKAIAAAKASGMCALADDSGLGVEVLNGEPGVYSARWAGSNKDFSSAMQKINEKIGNSLDRSAYFICSLALAWPDGHCEIFEGRVDGDVVWPPRGQKGFGYDPFFVPRGYNTTFAEMEPHEKHKMSHRAKAFEKLVQSCFKKS